MPKFNKIYNFTNENLSSFNKIYNFSNAKILSVLGSGDQYFTSLLNGASEIELYDINILAWDYFLLKYYCIAIFNYEDFFNYFVTKKLDDLQYFNHLIPYLPYNTRIRLENLYSKNQKLSWIFEYNSMQVEYNDGTIIPYLDKEKYYQLQTLLINNPLPKFYLSNFINLPKQTNHKHYDLILASNIFNHLYQDNELEKIIEYKELLNSFHYKEFQTLYCWWLNSKFKQTLEENNFIIDNVPSSKKLKLTDDFVISLRKK